MDSTGKNFINGKWQAGQGAAMQSYNPANNSIVWTGSISTEDDVNQAYRSARKAFPIWNKVTVTARCNLLHNFASQVREHQQSIAHLISSETGKPLWESITEVASVIAKISLSIQAHQERNKEINATLADAHSALRYKPLGVVAVLGAFNFPAHLSNGHIVPALLAGNTVVYKPSELSPAVAEIIMHCWHKAGLPDGVLNCIQGDASTGQFLLNEPVNGVFFTGSYTTGKRIHHHFSGRPEVVLALEMGGNNPLIVDNVDCMQAAIYQIVLSAFLTSGQRCTCARRLFIADSSQGDALLAQLLLSIAAISVGPFQNKPEPFMGPIISAKQALHFLTAQQQLIDAGSTPLAPMTLLHKNTGFLSPGILEITNKNQIFDQEIFAPLIQVYRYKDFTSAIEEANNTRYGLAAGLLSNDKEKYHQFYQTINAGLINWNRPMTGAVGTLPFGGVGASGNHRPSAYFASDYCAYPTASLENQELSLPQNLLPGITLG